MIKKKWESDIVTEEVCPPIPIRRFDWRAWIDDGKEEYLSGWGATELEAIDDLKRAMDSYE